LDVKNIFLLGNLSETIYAQQRSGFVDQNHPKYAYKINK
jgi:hypothetical protein